MSERDPYASLRAESPTSAEDLCKCSDSPRRGFLRIVSDPRRRARRNGLGVPVNGSTEIAFTRA